MVLKPDLESIDIWFRKVQPTLYAVPMLAFLLRHDCLPLLLGGHSMRSSATVRALGVTTRPSVHRRSGLFGPSRRTSLGGVILSCACRILAVAASAHRPVLRVLTGEA